MYYRKQQVVYLEIILQWLAFRFSNYGNCNVTKAIEVKYANSRCARDITTNFDQRLAFRFSAYKNYNTRVVAILETDV